MSRHGAQPVFALLDDGGSRLELGWRPRDARTRLKSTRHAYGDESWIKVHGRIRCPDGEWEFADSCLTEHEAQRLADLLSTRPWPDGPWLEFLEPCLAARPAGMSGRHPAIEWRFRGEAAPPWLLGDRDAVWTRGYVLEMTPDEAGLARFAATIRRLIGN